MGGGNWRFLWEKVVAFRRPLSQKREMGEVDKGVLCERLSASIIEDRAKMPLTQSWGPWGKGEKGRGLEAAPTGWLKVMPWDRMKWR